jgi:hypothetical protein
LCLPFHHAGLQMKKAVSTAEILTLFYFDGRQTHATASEE